MLGEYKQLNIFDLEETKENITLATVCENIEDMFKKTPEEEKYLKEWDEYIVKFRNKELEDKINKNQIEVELDIQKMFERSPKEFKHSYIYDKNNMDHHYETIRETLRYLFNLGYKYITINNKCDLWKNCVEIGNGAFHSPYAKGFVDYDYKKVALLAKENDLFYIQGTGFYKDTETTYIGYLGVIKCNTQEQ